MLGNDVAQEPDTNSETKEVIPDVLSATKLARTRPQIFTATSAVPKPLFGYRPFKQQVGGHLMVQDDPCFMLDDNGYLLKLLEEKSLKEKAFYDLVFIKEPENEEWLELKKYLPRYYGPVNVFNGIENLCYLKMDNLVSDLEKPCIMDLKIGKKTFDPFAAADKVQRELIRYKYQAQLGFRLTGFKVYRSKLGTTELYDRFHCKCIKPDDVVKTFAQFFDLGDFPERRLLVAELITKLKRLLKWFEKQTRIKFYRTSLLIAYDGNVKPHSIGDDWGISNKIENLGLVDLRKVAKHESVYQRDGVLNGKVQIPDLSDILGTCLLTGSDGMDNEAKYITSTTIGISMIDFAHTFIDSDCMPSTLDENYMFGLQSVINHLEQCKSL